MPDSDRRTNRVADCRRQRDRIATSHNEVVGLEERRRLAHRNIGLEPGVGIEAAMLDIVHHGDDVSHVPEYAIGPQRIGAVGANASCERFVDSYDKRIGPDVA